GGYPAGFDRGYSTGRLVAVTYGNSSNGNYHSYDRLGRVTASYQQTNNANYGFTYQYDLASEMTTQTYPTGRAITMSYDIAGRLSQVSGSLNGAPATLYASSLAYAPHGAVASLQLGNATWEHTTFNSRLQPLQIGLGVVGGDSSLMKLDYTYGVLVGGTPDATKNNGNIQSEKVTIGASAIKQTYLYDALNRLASAAEDL